MIDMTFLRPHPATAVWWSQRDQCAGCAHMVESPGALRGGMRCTVSPLGCETQRARAYETRQIVGMYCIDARAEGGPCGPSAGLFSPR